jgi:hypothetical protein
VKRSYTLADLQANLRQEHTADYRTFVLAGDHYTIGYEMGRAAPMRVVERYRDADLDAAFSAACAEQVARYHPGLLEEFRGYADAQDRTWEDVLSHFSLNLPEGILSGCTTIARRLADGHMLIARNYDFLYTQKQRYLRRLTPSHYAATLGTQAGLIGSIYGGVNSLGLFAALHLIHATIAPQVPPGVPYHLMPRIVLETCQTTDEAVWLLQQMPHLYAFNYLIADPYEMAAVEAYPGRVRVRRPESDYLIVTNYFAHPDMRPLQGHRRLTDQFERVHWLETRIAEDRVRTSEDGWEWAQAILRDHDTPICHHKPTQATLWSLLADLTGRRIAYCRGAPCHNPFEDWAWPVDR